MDVVVVWGVRLGTANFGFTRSPMSVSLSSVSISLSLSLASVSGVCVSVSARGKGTRSRPLPNGSLWEWMVMDYSASFSNKFGSSKLIEKYQWLNINFTFVGNEENVGNGQYDPTPWERQEWRRRGETGKTTRRNYSLLTRRELWVSGPTLGWNWGDAVTTTGYGQCWESRAVCWHRR